MKYFNCTQKDLLTALDKINEKYQGNVEFNRFDSQGFTLRVKNSKGPGHRLHLYAERAGWGNRRRGVSACWHVHGDFFDVLFDIAPDAVIYAAGRKITKNERNWEDWNIGSQMYPIYYSESCECA